MRRPERVRNRVIDLAHVGRLHAPGKRQVKSRHRTNSRQGGRGSVSAVRPHRRWNRHELEPARARPARAASARDSRPSPGRYPGTPRARAIDRRLLGQHVNHDLAEAAACRTLAARAVLACRSHSPAAAARPPCATNASARRCSLRCADRPRHTVAAISSRRVSNAAPSTIRKPAPNPHHARAVKARHRHSGPRWPGAVHAPRWGRISPPTCRRARPAWARQSHPPRAPTPTPHPAWPTRRTSVTLSLRLISAAIIR